MPSARPAACVGHCAGLSNGCCRRDAPFPRRKYHGLCRAEGTSGTRTGESEKLCIELQKAGARSTSAGRPSGRRRKSPRMQVHAVRHCGQTQGQPPSEWRGVRWWLFAIALWSQATWSSRSRLDTTRHVLATINRLRCLTMPLDIPAMRMYSGFHGPFVTPVRGTASLHTVVGASSRIRLKQSVRASCSSFCKRHSVPMVYMRPKVLCCLLHSCDSPAIHLKSAGQFTMVPH